MGMAGQAGKVRPEPVGKLNGTWGKGALPIDTDEGRGVQRGRHPSVEEQPEATDAGRSDEPVTPGWPNGMPGVPPFAFRRRTGRRCSVPARVFERLLYDVAHVLEAVLGPHVVLELWLVDEAQLAPRALVGRSEHHGHLQGEQAVLSTAQTKSSPGIYREEIGAT